MKHFTRAHCLFAAMLMVFSAVACGNTTTNDPVQTTAAVTPPSSNCKTPARIFRNPLTFLSDWYRI